MNYSAGSGTDIFKFLRNQDFFKKKSTKEKINQQACKIVGTKKRLLNKLNNGRYVNGLDWLIIMANLLKRFTSRAYIHDLYMTYMTYNLLGHTWPFGTYIPFGTYNLLGHTWDIHDPYMTYMTHTWPKMAALGSWILEDWGGMGHKQISE